MKLKLIIPAALLVVAGLSACSTSPEAATTPAANQQATAADDDNDGAGETKEEPLTGELKEKAEAAALAEFPGTVKKSEHDAERPGLYAVEIEKKSGGEVEVYLDTEFKVVGTKDEDGDKD
ncbi:hypothetical protein GCM10010168_18540 [Actinoplanes ianthinogenes]|uniref:PepSY domain-containing protein n=1 Tax=Actinoplanes ianthinogenes TaxID=122358 RepID=A0ABM7M753_9ACTN|nr:peptidase [Actinoplanes ianthinogenes]BCJ47496.1 hypothetical protein Aiant_81530 [Actinoplanes ianthinogenes]GGR02171.1 hypothetical protein GCM10010168_18540 [Actinoplanes ianthinogenes]